MLTKNYKYSIMHSHNAIPEFWRESSQVNDKIYKGIVD